MNDELTILAGLRNDIVEPDESAVHSAYAALMARQVNPKRRRRPRFVLAVAASALIIVPTALAVGNRVLDFFDGTPATPGVVQGYTRMNMQSNFAIKQGFIRNAPQIDVSKAHGVVEIQTADGPEQLWTAPTTDGSPCFYIDFTGDDGNGMTSCNARTADNISPGQEWNAQHPDVVTAWGRLDVTAATVTLTLADGSTKGAPVVENAYLVSLPKGARVAHVTAYDSSGTEVASTDVAPGPPSR